MILSKKKKKRLIVAVVAVLIFIICCVILKNGSEPQALPDNSTTAGTTAHHTVSATEAFSNVESVGAISADNLPEYEKSPFVVVNDNQPSFDINKKAEAFESYSKLDSLGRCGTAFACVCKETMPKDKRESISSVKPSGWQHVEYDFVDGGSLYNRCHLIGFQLTAENANERNLITGTRYMNTNGMNPFENMVADYVKETDNHVLYCVTPIFKGDELVARGVQMQAYSLEDNGEGICYNVYCFNVQPGVKIDYKSGANSPVDSQSTTAAPTNEKRDYVLNVRSHKFHLPECSGANDISPKNRADFNGTRQELIDEGYSPCGKCNP